MAFVACPHTHCPPLIPPLSLMRIHILIGGISAAVRPNRLTRSTCVHLGVLHEFRGRSSTLILASTDAKED
jgi:hypothetical protein